MTSKETGKLLMSATILTIICVAVSACAGKSRSVLLDPVPRAPFSSYEFTFSLAKDTLLPYEPIIVISTVKNVSPDSVPDIQLDINLSTPIKIRMYVDTFVLGCDNYYASYGIMPTRWLAPGESKSQERKICAEVESWRVPIDLRSLKSGRVEVILLSYPFSTDSVRARGNIFTVLPFTVRSVTGDELGAFNLMSAARDTKMTRNPVVPHDSLLALIAKNHAIARDTLHALIDRYPGSGYRKLAETWLMRFWPGIQTHFRE
jgi:hypothetical protein